MENRTTQKSLRKNGKGAAKSEIGCRQDQLINCLPLGETVEKKKNEKQSSMSILFYFCLAKRRDIDENGQNNGWMTTNVVVLPPSFVFTFLPITRWLCLCQGLL